MSSFQSLGIGSPGRTRGNEPSQQYIVTQRPLQRVLAFRGRSIDDVVNDWFVKNEIVGYWKLHKQIARSSEIVELEHNGTDDGADSGGHRGERFITPSPEPTTSRSLCEFRPPIRTVVNFGLGVKRIRDIPQLRRPPAEGVSRQSPECAATGTLPDNLPPGPQARSGPNAATTASLATSDACSAASSRDYLLTRISHFARMPCPAAYAAGQPGIAAR